MPTRILLADDHKMIRDTLRGLLAADDSMEVVGEASTGAEAVQLVRKLSRPRSW